jgi:hypothetical protein
LLKYSNKGERKFRYLRRRHVVRMKRRHVVKMIDGK